MDEAPRNIRDLARRLGLAHSTVSMALRNHPRIAAATRARVQAEAAACGYAANPLVATLLSQVQAGRLHTAHLPLGLLSAWPQHEVDLHRYPVFSAYLEGAEERARQLGYYLVPLPLGGPRGLPPNRLQAVVRARGLRGILVPPVSWDYIVDVTAGAGIEPLFGDLAAIAISLSLRSPRLHRVVPDHYANALLACESLASGGCRRIGLVLTRRIDRRTNHRWSAGFGTFQRLRPSAEQVPPLWLDDWNDTGAWNQWLAEARPDSLIIAEDEVYGLVARSGLDPVRDLQVAHLDLISSRRATMGIDQHPRQIGATAIEAIVAQIQQNSFGCPAVCRLIGVEGSWRERPR